MDISMAMPWPSSSTTRCVTLVHNLCIAILLTASAWPSATGNDFTCGSITETELSPYKHCAYDLNSERSVICEMQNVIVDTVSIKYLFYLHIRFNFTIIDKYGTNDAAYDTANNSSEDVSFCLGLSSVHVSKVYGRDPWKNATLGLLPKLGVIFIDEIKKGYVHATFNSSIPVAFLDLNRECWLKERTSSSCLKTVRLSEDVRNPTKKKFTYDLDFWNDVKHMYMRTLQGRISVNFDISPSLTLFLTAVFENAFEEWNLVECTLNGGRFTRGPPFSYMPGLKALTLKRNDISDIKPDMFSRIPNVERLILANNLIKKFPDGFQNLSNLSYLDISGNPLVAVGSPGGLMEQLAHLCSLQHLNLAYTPLKSSRDLRPLLANESCVRLLSLNLSHTGINVLDDEDVFRYQTSLRDVDLSHNHLTKLPPGLFRYNENLTTLDLSSNSFSVGPMLDLGPHKVLEMLNLANNRLGSPSNITKSGYIDLLDLSNNTISQWNDVHIFKRVHDVQDSVQLPAVLYSAMPWVQRLNLSSNRIITVTESMGKSTENLSAIDLGGNPFDCTNCHTPEFQEWLHSVSRMDILNSGTMDRLVCSLPSSERNKPIIEVSEDIIEDCEGRSEGVNLYLTVGIPLGIIFLVMVVSGIAMYRLRFEITYILHLFAVKKNAKNKRTIEDYEYDAFICFSGKDRPWVIGKLLPKLENGPEKFRICMHERDFVLGSYISQNIVSSMHGSRHTIMVLTKNFVESQWCRYELEIANHKLFENNHNFLILLEYERLDRNKLPKHLKYLMTTRTYLEWPEDENEEEEAWKRLQEALGPSIDSTTEMS
ncbi:toll-like receptor 2 [Periplaneta americana]|uniref:toll-like receptor 2 n=1 Tax=Periplaneta americana TaxID=6978 RepID=UPI0037E9C417